MVYKWVPRTTPDPRPKVVGQENYGPLPLPRMKGPMHLWNHVKPPPAQNTLLIYRDGEVVEGNLFPSEVFADPDLHTFLTGGQDWRCPDLDPFVLASLMAAGYSCCEDRLDIYSVNDEYHDEYDQGGSC